MRRQMLALAVLSGLIYGSSSKSSGSSIEQDKPTRTMTFAPANPQDGHTIKITPLGPTQEMIDAAKAGFLRHPSVRDLLKGIEYRLISFQLIESGMKTDAAGTDGIKATIFDYTNNRGFDCIGRLDGAELQITPLVDQPHPDVDEFDAAVQIAARDKSLGPPIVAGELRPYHPMPPLVYSDVPVGKANRTIAVGLMPKGTNYLNQIVGVDLIGKKVVRFPGNAPPAAVANPAACGLTSSGSQNARNLAGQAEIQISRDGVEIWRFTIVRPSASSGLKGSAVELLAVNYRGKRVLAQAHVPILNVQYDRNLCGPYRDWQWQEGTFNAPGTDVAPGIRMCTGPPQTILESGDDSGNPSPFRGVAVYDKKEEVTVVSELNASWYRYISRWTFTDQGVIKPRFGFGAVQNSCVCNIHTHHVYWRLNFDLNTAGNNTVADNLPTGDELVISEGMRPRIDRLNQTFTISNSASGESLVLRPGPWDGNYDKYGKGDVWVLLNKAGEIDDGVTCTTCTASIINIAPFANGESTQDQDIVVWYGAHFNHINGNVACGTAAGPDIEITKW